MNFGLDATSAATVWATIGLVIFIGIAIYFGVPKMVAGMIDARIKTIENELRTLKQDQQNLGMVVGGVLEDFTR